MSDNSRLSSEQALDDYFFDLLDDTVEEPALACDVDEQPVDELPVVVSTVQTPSEQELNNDDPRPVESGSDDQTVFEPAGVVDPVDVAVSDEETVEEAAEEAVELSDAIGIDASEIDVSEQVAHVQQAASSVCAPFDFTSLSSEAEERELAAEPVASFFNDAPAPMSHSSQFSALPLTESVPASASRASWFDVPTERDDLQRLLSQVSVLAEPEPVIEPATESATMLGAGSEALADDWALVMAHEATQESPVDIAPEAPMAQVSSIEINTVSAAVAEQDMALPDLTVHDLAMPAEPDVFAPTVSLSPDVDAIPLVVETKETETALATQASADLPPDNWQQQDALGNAFQALFFEVNGVTFAVPLTALGGIHQLGEMNHLVGRPPWYFGLMTNRDQTMDVVDTARWVMPERLVDDEHREAYRYLVMLGESRWGLACDGLQGTQTLEEHSVRWRETAGKRPWLAGMVKEKMCALIHVPELIAMLDAGLDVQTTLQQA